MITLIGCNGSMGRRYQAIFNFLKWPYKGFDVETKLGHMGSAIVNSDAIVLATPTDLHYKQLQTLIEYKKPILCEKPISKDLREVEKILNTDVKLSMVWQYRMLDKGRGGPSWYDYYNTGKDGLLWDCIQIISLARGTVAIDNKSPTWNCCLNGNVLNLAEMDHAYISFLRHWRDNMEGDKSEIYRAHERVLDYGKAHGYNRDTGEVNINKVSKQNPS